MKTFRLSLILLALTVGSARADSGDSCAEAVTINQGTHEAPKAPYWYQFTMPESGKGLVISSVGLTTTDTYLKVYDACNGNLLATSDDYTYGQSQVIIYSLSKDDVVYIEWADNYSAAGFRWKLELIEVSPGDDCTLPVTAYEGTNVIPENAGTHFWYEFTMPRSGTKMTVSTSANTYIQLFTNTCSELIELNSGTAELTVYDVSEGESIFIRWELYEGGNFPWNLLVEDVIPGESCSTPLLATVGNNIYQGETLTTYWYEYTMPSADSKMVISTHVESYVSVYRGGDCLTPNIINSGYMNLSVTDILQGETVRIFWQVYDNVQLSWTLDIQELEPGELCTTALTALEGTNTVSAVPYYWYEFTMPAENSKIVITSEGNAGVYAFSNDCSNAEYLNSGYGGLILLEVSAGEKILLLWDNYDAIQFDWQLSVEQIAPGDNCQHPHEITAGTHEFTHSPHWYVYTVPEADKEIIITSVGYTSEDTYLVVLTECNGSIIQQSDDFEDTQQSQLSLTNFDAGDKIYILWSDYYTRNGFSWNLSLHDIAKISLSNPSLTQTVAKGEAGSISLDISNPGKADLDYDIGQSLGLSFTDNEDMVYIPSNASFNTSSGITVSLWLYLIEDLNCNSYNNFRYLFSKGSFVIPYEGYHVIVEEDRTLTWSLGTTDGVLRYHAETPINIGEWVFLSFTYSAASSEAKIYLNGEELTGAYWTHDWPVWGGGILSTDEPLLFNYATYEPCSFGYGHLPSYMDDFSLWNKALTQEQIRQTMLHQVSVTAPNLVSYWDFEEIEDGMIPDKTNAQNHGYAYGLDNVIGAPVNGWLSFTPANGSIAAGSSARINLTADATDLDQKNYTAQMTVLSNDPKHPAVKIPITLKVTAPLGINKDALTYTLEQNYPNPVTTETIIGYHLPANAQINLTVYNLQGQRIVTLKDGYQTSGTYRITWTGLDALNESVPNGMYFYRLVVLLPDGHQTSASKRMIISR
ncbi:LamG-like jellyroll fold domain-containing protein [Marinoscillum sp.]|uniref:LamG domain-containing protein n=1 Tax=Marinoscillum sp. TaxID=2024838 RepID=UPI003BA9CA07